MQPAHVLDFWLGALDDDGASSPAHTRKWFTKDESFDRTIRDRFESFHASLRDGSSPGAEWDTPEGRVAQVIVLDQFPRNMFRGTGRMYETDAAALKLSEGLRPSLPSFGVCHAIFSVMPFMHAENLEAQDECIRLFTELSSDESRSEDARAAFANNLKYAHSHRDVVARFGRFPHRNALLSREDTPEEAEYLKDPKAGW